jgi:amidase
VSDEFAALDATAQAALVHKRLVHPSELVEAAIGRIERLNPQLNAVITDRFEQALVEARSPQLANGPFRGVPLLLKDFRCEMAGEPYYAGMKLLRNLGWRSTHDTNLAKSFRQAGFVILGKTNLPELAGGPITEPEAFGPTRNPWNLAYTPGGSSGGSAAAVAAGMTPVAHANDGTGSIRIPASCCGLVGLKPSRGRISSGPGRNEGLAGNIAEFVLARSLHDVAGLLDAVSGPMPGDLVLAPPAHRPYVHELQVAPGKLRIGLMLRDPLLQLAAHPTCVAAVEMTAKLLEALGHIVEYAYPSQLDGITGLGLGLGMISTSRTAATLDAWAARIGRAIGPADVEPATWEAAARGRSFSAVQIHEAYDWLITGACGVLAWWQSGYDLLLTPTMLEPPTVIGEKRQERLRSAFGLLTMPYSFTGQPAISLPVYWDGNGLPIGVQLVADLGREDLLLQVSSQLEQSLRWANRRPALLKD